MSLDWEEYLIFAENLIGIIEGKITSDELSSQEVLLRNAISRAYYAAYHYALDYLLANTDFQFTKYDSHIGVINAYTYSIYRDRKAISVRLRRMRDARVRADYEADYAPSNPNPEKILFDAAKRTVDEANEVLRMVRNFKPRNNRQI
jgi:uncharacterized protein (UPF0332 family)